jgi:hypothetical protein
MKTSMAAMPTHTAIGTRIVVARVISSGAGAGLDGRARAGA